jgi:hypothetical protein
LANVSYGAEYKDFFVVPVAGARGEDRHAITLAIIGIPVWIGLRRYVIIRVMRFKSPRVTFEPEQSKTGAEWQVVATLSGIRAKRIQSFKSRDEAETWIRVEAGAWLQKFEGGRYAPGS